MLHTDMLVHVPLPPFMYLCLRVPGSSLSVSAQINPFLFTVLATDSQPVFASPLPALHSLPLTHTHCILSSSPELLWILQGKLTHLLVFLPQHTLPCTTTSKFNCPVLHATERLTVGNQQQTLQTRADLHLA